MVDYIAGGVFLWIVLGICLVGISAEYSELYLKSCTPWKLLLAGFFMGPIVFLVLCGLLIGPTARYKVFAKWLDTKARKIQGWIDEWLAK